MGAVVLAVSAAGPTEHTAEATDGVRPLTAALSSSTELAGQRISLSAAATAPKPTSARSHGVGSDQIPERASRSKPRVSLTPKFVRPSKGRLTSCFCARWGTFHEGIDLAAPEGSPIVAAAAGVVTRTGPSQGFGYLIIVKLPDGTENWYGHEEATLVHVGQHVVAGQKIALEGSEGESTGPHLHFQVMVHGEAIDPIPWLRARGVTV